MLLIRAGCSLFFTPEKRAGKAFSTASLSTSLKAQLDKDHKAMPAAVTSISLSVMRHHENDAFICGRLFHGYFASAGWEVGRGGAGSTGVGREAMG